MNLDLSFCQAFACECISISIKTGQSDHLSLKTVVRNAERTRNANTSLEDVFLLSQKYCIVV